MTTFRMPHTQLLPRDDDKTLVMDRPAACLNCRTILAGAFCHSCGQAAKTPPRLTFLGILAEIPRAIWDLDRSLPYTIWALLRRPGHTVREYLEGRRTKVYSPTALLFLLSSFAVLTAVTRKTRVMNMDVNGNFEVGGKTISAASFVAEYYPWMAVVMVPMMALGPLVVLRKRMKYGYGEQVIARMLIAAGATAIGILGGPVEWLVKGTVLAPTAMAIMEGGKFLYEIWAFAQLQDDPKHVRSAASRWGLAILSFVGSVVGVFVVLLGLTLVVVAVALAWKKLTHH